MTFESFFHDIHGYDPFPWQSEAVRLVLANESPLAVNVPTASGKTALIDAAVFAAAHGGPRRIAFIIDRRVVVDEAYFRAQRIAEALNQPSMAGMAQKLGQIQVVRLRGGVHGDDGWVLYPDRLTIIVSTVDQVGSRLLHRGYGVSPRMAPLHAGFVGNDCVFIIDEAHISVPFVETVQACRAYGAGIRLITMTATPISEDGPIVRLSKKDRAHPVLRRRLQASKQVELLTAPGVENDFVKAAVKAAEQLAESLRVIAVVVNRVATARKIWKVLVKRRFRAELLTGRVRPYDRDQLMKRIFPEIYAGRLRDEGSPLFIVATQTIEVGADIDFDGLVTEAAPLDALRQRFGRLDRLGELGNTQGIILYREPKCDKNDKPLPDPVYGAAIQETWEWLQNATVNGGLDFGITAMEKSMKRHTAPVTEPKRAPVLLSSHIMLLSQTGPEAPAVDVSSWLHGTGSASSDVSVIWRADLLPDDPTRWEEAVGLRPPLSREALEIPVFAVRSWLQGRRTQDLTDLEGQPHTFTPVSGLSKQVLAWRGPDNVKVVQVGEIIPGDTIVVSAQYGGCDEYGWAPDAKKPVPDIADFCSLERRGSHIVRLVPGLTSWLGVNETSVQEAMREILSAETEIDSEIGIDQDRVKAAHASLRTLLKEVDHPLIKSFGDRFEIELHPLGAVLRGRVLDEVEATFMGGVAVTLSEHLDGVAQMVDALAAFHPEHDKIRVAAHIHDMGKKEPRFQIMLHGDPFAAAAGPLLAKSGLRRLSAQKAAYAQSGLPKGFRHELASLALSAENDPLIRYLVATHHGYGRPWFPDCEDKQALGVENTFLDGGWLQSFASLCDGNGPWVLSGMELLLRAADARQSIAERELPDA